MFVADFFNQLKENGGELLNKVKDNELLSKVQNAEFLDRFKDSEDDAIFREFDSNKDGRINKEELKAAFDRMGIECTDLELSAMFAAADKNRDGTIDASEFKNLVKGNPSLDRLNKAFKQFDLDGDGWIIEDEFKKALKFLGQDMTEVESNQLFKTYDRNNDGRVDFAEFSQLMKNHPLSCSLRAIFSQVDINNDGYITENEFFAAAKTLQLPTDENELRALFRTADINGDGRITFDEFEPAMTNRLR